MTNTRFHGAWRLESVDAKAADGTPLEPLGTNPVGIIIWDESGAFSAQLGERDGSVGPYVAYFGTLEAPDGDEGTLIHHVSGASVSRLLTDQSRHFRFVGEDELVLTPPPRPGGPTAMSLRWHRIRA